MTLHDALARAREQRAPLIEQLEDEGTDSYRLFHGIAEGRPRLTLDRYGRTVLGQLWGSSLTEAEEEAIEAAYPEVVWRTRGTAGAHTRPTTCRERGLSFAFQAVHDGIDPWLFLDFRAGRRWLAEHIADHPGARVLNTFSYTATAGVVAAAAGASRVVNVDHARGWTRIGRDNARKNGVEMTFLQLDYFAVVRQLASLKVGRRGRQLPKVKREPFDVVVLDPPTLAKGPYGSVDIERDYPGLFKPAWLCLEPGGVLLATNHSAKVSRDDWLAQCRRCADKAGRPVTDIEVIEVDADFPSFDGAHPLKMAAFR